MARAIFQQKPTRHERPAIQALSRVKQSTMSAPSIPVTWPPARSEIGRFGARPMGSAPRSRCCSARNCASLRGVLPRFHFVPASIRPRSSRVENEVKSLVKRRRQRLKSIRDFCVAFLKREYTGTPPRRRANVADHANTTHVYLEAKLATPATRRAPSPREGAARAAQAPRGPESEIGASRCGRVS